jgi:hypothetical protein
MSRLLVKAVVTLAVVGLLWLPDQVQLSRFAEVYHPSGGGPEAMEALALRQHQTLGIAAPSDTNYDAAPVDQLFPPPREKAAHVEITQGPELEVAHGNIAIIAWTTNNPGGTDQHFAVAYYGTNPRGLDQAAQSPIRLNRGHPDTVFRVRVNGLKPYTTYYYSVTSMGSDGTSDREQSPVRQFTTPGPGD